MTIRDLLERVARGDLTSCPTTSEAANLSRPRRQTKGIVDDEDYDNNLEGSGDDPISDEDEYYYVEPEHVVEDIVDKIGDDEDLVICDNIERALYLSLKYEFVTPLTSLVVVSPDQAPQEGDLSEAAREHNRRHDVQFHSKAAHSMLHGLQLSRLLFVAFFAGLSSQWKLLTTPLYIS